MSQPVAGSILPVPDQDGPAERKKRKKKKLSKAERKRLKLLAAMELRKRLLREQLLREIELTKKSLKRGKFEFEEVCKQIKLKELQEEVKDWSEKAGRLIQKKDEKIDMLMKNLDETQELHERNFSQHLVQLDYLTKCHQTLRDTATELYNVQASEMVQDYLWDLSYMQEIQERMKLNNENIMHSSNVVAKARLRKNYESYMIWKFDEVTTEIEHRYLLRDATVKKMRALQDQLLLWIKRLQGDMVDVHKTERFVYFMQRQRNYVLESGKLNEIERLSRKTIVELQKELLNIEADSNRKIYGLKLEQAYFLEVRSIIKQSIARNNQLTHTRLLGVASESYRVINKMKEIVKTGELLLSLCVCCRKYETEKEKVIPWTHEYEDKLNDSEFMFKMTFDLVKLLDISEEELIEQMGYLKNFWFRCSNVKVHNLLLMEEKRKLNEENEKYRNIIRSMKKSDDVADILESLQISSV